MARRPPIKVWVSGVIAAFVALALFLVLWVPHWQASQAITDPTKTAERFEAENKARATVLQGFQALGGTFFFVTAYFTWRQLQAAEETRRITEDKNVTDRFIKAVEMLDDDKKMSVRLGGIYSLERIAKDSEKDLETVLEEFISYARYRSFKNQASGDHENISEDVQAILTIIGKRWFVVDDIVDFSYLDIRHARLRNAYLNKVSFANAVLNEADFTNAHLSETIFSDQYSKVCFNDAFLTKANLNGAIFQESSFIGTILIDAKLEMCRLEKCYFQNADLTNANLAGAVLKDSWLNKNTKLDNANIDRADLSKVFYLGDKRNFINQLKGAKNYEKALYSPEVTKELGLEAQRAETAEAVDKLWNGHKEWKGLNIEEYRA